MSKEVKMTTVNGIEVSALNAMIEAVKQEPGLARCTFHSRTVWKGGFQNQAEVDDYLQAGGKVDRGRTFHITGDHPDGLLGQNTGPAAVEALIAALGACIAGGWATFGAAQSIPVDALEIDLEGDIDLQGFMGLGVGVRPGLERIRGTIYIKSRASDEQLNQLKETVEKLSPVMDSLRVPVETRLVRV